MTKITRIIGAKKVTVNIDDTTAKVLLNTKDEELICHYLLLEKEEENHNRKESRRHVSLENLTEHGINFSDNSNLIDEVICKDFISKIQSLLTKKQWTVFKLIYIYGKTTRSAAEILQVTQSTIRDTINAIKKIYLRSFQ